MSLQVPLLLSLSFASLNIDNSVASETSKKNILTKKEALKTMQKESSRWQQTNTLEADAEAKTMEARAATSPQVGFFAREFGANINPVQYGIAGINISAIVAGSVGLDVKWSLLDFASNTRIKAAYKNEEINNAKTDQYRDDLIALMLVQYLTVQKTQKSLEAVDAAIFRDGEVIRFAEKRIQAGASVQLDLTRAKGLLAKDEYKKIELKGQLTKACADLAVTLSVEKFKCRLSPLEIEPLPHNYLDDYEFVNLDNRADIRAARATTAAAELLEQFQRKENLPKLQLFGQIGSAGTAQQVFGVGGNFSGLAGIQVVFPVLDGGLNAGKTQVEGVKAIQASLQDKYLMVEAKSQLSISRSQLEDTLSIVTLSEQNIQIAEEELNFAQEKQKLGSATSLELSNAQVNLASAYDLNIQTIFAYEMTKVGYFKTIGRIEKYFELGVKKE